VAHPRYLKCRRESLKRLNLLALDRPIVELIEGFSLLPHCFTLQSCYGHFRYAPGQDPRNMERLPCRGEDEVRYRVAYVAFCLENSLQGRALRESLESLALLDPDYVQFGSADWFWERCQNSYVVQVEPARFMTEDEIMIEHSEALHIEEIRDCFFIKLKEVFENHVSERDIGHGGWS